MREYNNFRLTNTEAWKRIRLTVAKMLLVAIFAETLFPSTVFAMNDSAVGNVAIEDNFRDENAPEIEDSNSLEIEEEANQPGDDQESQINDDQESQPNNNQADASEEIIEEASGNENSDDANSNEEVSLDNESSDEENIDENEVKLIPMEFQEDNIYAAGDFPENTIMKVEKLSYYNGSASTDTHVVYDEGTVYFILSGDANMEITKSWKDEDDTDRRGQVIDDGVTLYLWRYPKNRSAIENAPVKDENGNQYVFRFTRTNAMADTFTINLESFVGSSVTLPKYDEQGQEYIYNVTEVISNSALYRHFCWNKNLDEYGADSISDSIVKDGGNLLNIRFGEIRPKGSKFWDVSAIEDYVGSEVELTLQRYIDGTWKDVVVDSVPAKVTLSGFTRAGKTVGDLFGFYPRYDENGKKYVYRIIETKVKHAGDEVIIPSSAYGSDGYDASDPSYECSAEYKFKGSIKLSKRWDDYNDDYELRESKIEAQVYISKDGGTSWLPYKTIVLSKDNKWASTISNLPYYKKGANGAKGSAYQYKILETKIIKDESTTLVVGAPTADDGSWKDPATEITYTDLPFTEKVANYCVYHPKVISELQATNNAMIVNKLSDDNTTKLKVRKTWDDNNNSLGFRPESITVQLQRRVHRDAPAAPEAWVRVTEKKITKKHNSTDDPNVWEIVFDNLPQYYQADVMYEYRVVEIDHKGNPINSVSGQVAAYNSVRKTDLDGVYDPTNECYNTELANSIILRSNAIKVRKIWNDELDHGADSIEVSLYSRNFKSGMSTGDYEKILESKTLNEANGWTEQYANLPVYNMDGEVIIYGIFESLSTEQASKYYESYTQNIGSAGFTYCEKTDLGSSSTPDEAYEVRIINTLKTKATLTKKWDDMSNKLKLRPASVTAVLQRSADGGASFENVDKVDITKTTGSKG